MKRYIRSSEIIEVDNEGNAVPADVASVLKDSKIRDRKGHLIVCYHGTNAEFTEFKEDFISHQKAILTTKTKETKVSKPKNLKERIKELENLLELCKKYNEVEKVRVIEKELEELRKIEKEK